MCRRLLLPVYSIGGTFYYFNDAMYPNLLTSQFLFVVAVAALVALYYTPSPRTSLALALFGSSVVLYHPVASLYLAALLVLVRRTSSPYLLATSARRGFALLASFALLGSLSVLYAWEPTTCHRRRQPRWAYRGKHHGYRRGMAVGTQVPYPLDFLVGTMVTQPVAWLGLLGALFLWRAAGPRQVSNSGAGLSHPSPLTLLLFLGSRTSLFAFPQRFGATRGYRSPSWQLSAFVTILRSLQLPGNPRLSS